MVGMSDVWETENLQLYFHNDDAAGIGDAGGLRGSVTAGNCHIALHTADPTDAGTQSSSEATFTGYARVAVPRDTASWQVAGPSATNNITITFPSNTGSPQQVTHVSIGDDASGAGKLRLSAALTSAFTINNGVQFQFLPGELAVNFD